MWLKMPEGRHCPNCGIPCDHWVLYGETGQIAVDATFCPVCYADVTGIFTTHEHRREELSPAVRGLN